MDLAGGARNTAIADHRQKIAKLGECHAKPLNRRLKTPSYKPICGLFWAGLIKAYIKIYVNHIFILFYICHAAGEE
jgi:hypothetical protein